MKDKKFSEHSIIEIAKSSLKIDNSVIKGIGDDTAVIFQESNFIFNEV